MQTFSNMRRNSTHKQTLLSLLLLIGFYIYESVASMQMWLPPLIGVSLVFFIRYDKQDRMYHFLAIIGCIVFIESENSLPMGTLLGLFLVLALFVIPRVQMMFDSMRITRLACVLSAYIGFYIIALVVDMMTGSTIAPSLWIMLYYIVLEIIVAIFI